jgi:hypothetical protein
MTFHRFLGVLVFAASALLSAEAGAQAPQRGAFFIVDIVPVAPTQTELEVAGYNQPLLDDVLRPSSVVRLEDEAQSQGMLRVAVPAGAIPA